MTTINVRQLSGKSALLTRSTADAILKQVDALSDPIEVDLAGIVAIAPSFIDQLIGGLSRMNRVPPESPFRIHLLSVPTHASEKFAAIGRSYGLALDVGADNEWTLKAASSAPSRQQG